MVLSCRFYGAKFPEVEDVVMVNVRQIAEMGAYVNLLEYDNIEGMVRCMAAFLRVASHHSCAVGSCAPVDPSQ